MSTRRRSSPWPGAIAVALGLALLAGCGGLDTIKQGERARRLSDDLRVYGKLVRWGEFSGARAFIQVRPESEVRDPNPPGLLAAIKVTHYRLSDTVYNADLSEAAVAFELKFFHQDTRREVSGVDRQVWYWSEELSRWLLDGTLPDFSGAH